MPALSAPLVRSRTFSALALMLASALASTDLSADSLFPSGTHSRRLRQRLSLPQRRCSVRRPASAAPSGGSWCSGLCQNRSMEVTWYGHSCIRLRGREAVVVADPYQAVVGPTGRGISGDIVTFSHPDDRPLPRAKGKHSRDGRTLLPSSLDSAFVLDGPGEYEVKEVLVTGVRTYRDDARGVEAGKQVAFVVEVDGVHTIHLGDIGHLLSEEKLGDIGSVDIACVPLGGTLTPAQAAALIAQLDPKIVVPMPICDDDADCADALKRFFHEMGAEAVTQPKLSVTASSLPTETTPVLLESRGKQV